MRQTHRYLVRLWLAAESSLATLGFVVLVKSLFNADNLPSNEVAATVVCMILLGVVAGSLWTHVRAEVSARRVPAIRK